MRFFLALATPPAAYLFIFMACNFMCHAQAKMHFDCLIDQSWYTEIGELFYVVFILLKKIRAVGSRLFFNLDLLHLKLLLN